MKRDSSDGIIQRQLKTTRRKGGDNVASLNPKKALQCPNCGANVVEDAVRCDYCRSVLTLAACPFCFGAVFKGMKHCPNCGKAIDRHDATSSLKSMCPCCELLLKPADIGGTRISECDICGGIWLDTASFQKICESREQQERVMIYNPSTDSAKPQTEIRAGKFYIPCPECGELMNQKNFAGCSGVVIDVCKAHGIWFERQELQRIVNFIQDGGMHKARERELAKLKEEQNNLNALKYSQDHDQISIFQESSRQILSEDRSLIDAIYDIAKKILR